MTLRDDLDRKTKGGNPLPPPSAAHLSQWFDPAPSAPGGPFRRVFVVFRREGKEWRAVPAMSGGEWNMGGQFSRDPDPHGPMPPMPANPSACASQPHPKSLPNVWARILPREWLRSHEGSQSKDGGRMRSELCQGANRFGLEGALGCD